jgi:hypothetical protein
MLTIRPAQWQALTVAGLTNFEHEMVQHLTGFAPELANVMGRERMHELVRLGIERAKAYGFTARGPLRSYLEMMLALGSSFDTDPALTRATAALRSAGVEQHKRAAALYEGVLDYCEQVNGLQNEHAMAAMKRVRDAQYESLAGAGAFEERGLTLFRLGFPQKYEYAAQAALRHVLQTALRTSEQYGVHSGSGRLLIASLLYAFGHGVFVDPAYRWIPHTMRDTAIADPEQRVRHLHRKTHIYIAAALKNLSA